MTGLPDTEPAVPTLAALRAARASRIAALRRRAAPIGTIVVILLAVQISKSHPRPGISGRSLVITVAACCFIISFAALIRLISRTLPLRPAWQLAPRAQTLFMALLVASSVTLQWLQSSYAGSAGVYAVVTISARMYSRRVSAVLFVACLTYYSSVALLAETVGSGKRAALPGFPDVIALIAVYLMSLSVGRIRTQEAQEERLLAELEESRAAELRAVALAERQRLAREMHDVLAHSLSGLVLQLEGARLLAVSAPDDPRLPETVDRAHQLAKSGLDEARQAIAMLRDDDLPGPDRLSDLADAFTADTGIPCRCTQAGPRRDLSSAVRLALYRVTQEALTNVRKHARPDEVSIRLEYLKQTVTLTVEDTTADLTAETVPAQTASGGYGLTGMRERAELLGGTVTAGPTDTGFRVRLEVPA